MAVDWGPIIGGVIGTGIGSFGGPITAGIGGTIGAGVGGMFGGGGGESVKASKDDPLAGIRSQLQALSSQIPGMVARQKELIGGRYGEARKTSLENLQEQMHGVRGFGASSLEPKYMATELDRLARGQAEEELKAELAGMGLQSKFLGQEAEYIPIEEQPATDWGTSLLGMGGQLLGGVLGSQDLGNLAKGWDFGSTKTSSKSGYDFQDIGMGERPDLYKAFDQQYSW